MSRDSKSRASLPEALDRLVGVCGDPLCVVAEDGRLLRANAAFEQRAGRPADSLVGCAWTDLIHVDDRAPTLRSMQAAVGGADPAPFLSRLAHTEGSHCWVEWTIAASGGVLCAAGRDVTERVELERALAVARQRYRNMMDNAPDAIVMFDLDSGRFVEANRVAEDLFRMPRAHLLQVGPVEVSPRVQPCGRLSGELAMERIGEALRGGAPHFEWTHRDSRGRDFLCDIQVVRMPSTGDQRLVRGSIQDITERRRLEEELHHSRKMEAIGRLAGGVAHDFNNLLTVINGYAETALSAIEPRDPVVSHLGQILDAGERAAALTAQLLAFSRKQVLRPQVLDLNALVERQVDMLRRLIGEQIELVTRLDEALRPVEVDPGHIDQIILNLAVNARDAMREGGRLTITTQNAEAPGAPPDGFAVIAVSDTGPGIPEAIRERIFEPFFTTKSQGEGTGLGLSTVYGIVQQNGGQIVTRSHPGEGTTFEILLPATAKPEGAVHPHAAGSTRGDETILVAEDEKALRDLVVEGLSSHGYRVFVAANGNEALALAAHHAGAIDLIVSDVVMPGMSGPDLVARLRATRPRLDVIFVSGHADDRLPAMVTEAGVRFLPKPFRMEALARTIRELLDQDHTTVRSARA